MHEKESSKYRLAREGNLHVLPQLPASAYINRPVGKAKIPAGACYQKTLLKNSYV